jgi:membrane-associated phospholipid phosphatase
VLKQVVDRARPPGAVLQGLLDPGFPSGHTARVTALLVLVLAWWCRGDDGPPSVRSWSSPRWPWGSPG